ncbi:MAG: TonB-dependent receptor [Chitinophagaceae bacterium]
MTIAIHPKKILQQALLAHGLLCVMGLLFSLNTAIAQQKDSAKLLKNVNVAGLKIQQPYNSATPLQRMNSDALQQLNAPSVGDAARYFSGALVKDYGGIGGLKTISVRSLGAASTGIIYDGMPVTDVQTGQVDLSRYSTTFIQALELQQGGFQQNIATARAYASAAALSINSNMVAVQSFQKQKWQAGLKAGSFNLWQPFAGILQPLKNNTVVSFNAEALYSKGDYPFTINNGNYSEKTRRDNADTKSIQAEANLLKQFKDSATLQVKAGIYSSARGLPGAIVFFNTRSVQRLWNTDYFVQSRYRKKINEATALLFSGKYSNTYTKYKDPDFLNGQGGLNNRYTQQEVYASVAASHNFSKALSLNAASDIAYNTLSANTTNFASPRRTSFWENIALQYTHTLWQLNGSLLYTGIIDKINNGNAAGAKNKWTPALALKVQPSATSPFTLRAFYKAAFRMPTFNDLYYNFIGNSNLRPEYSQQFNLGAAYTKSFQGFIKRLGISADAYYNRVQDKIVAVPGQNLFVWTMLNIGKVAIKGIDINTDASGRFSAKVEWTARIAYTLQQALDITDKSSSSYKNRIPYTPDNAGSALFSVQYNKWSVGWNALFSGTRYTLGDNSPATQLDGWMTQDVFVTRQLPLKQFTVHIRAEADNITNQHYDVVQYFPMPGRSYKISLLFNNL